MTGKYLPVLDYWFRELRPGQWFEGGDARDEDVRNRFAPLLRQALSGELDHWAAEPRGRLALIIVLDQFARHIHRGSGLAFAGATRAEALALEGLDSGVGEALGFDERQFLCMPLMHAEDSRLQTRSLREFRALRAYADDILDYAERHAQTIERFGRFPYRNAALGRQTTSEEANFLEDRED